MSFRDLANGGPSGVRLTPRRARKIGSPRVSAIAPGGWELAAYYDARPFTTPVENQGANSCCVLCGMTTYWESETWWLTGRRVQLDYLKLYEAAKAIDGDGQDGTTEESGLRAMQQQGLWLDREVQDLDTIDDIGIALHRDRLCLGIFDVTDGWEGTDAEGYVWNRGAKRGLHLVLIHWWKDGSEVGIKNSWGRSWGLNGNARFTLDEFERCFVGGVAIARRA